MSVYRTALFINILKSSCKSTPLAMQNAASSKGPVGLGLGRKWRGLQIAPLSSGSLSGSPGLCRCPDWSLCPLTAVVSLCSRKEHLWDNRPPFSREDGVDHPSDCGISLDLRVPHPSHCCASLLEVSKPGSTCMVRGVGAGSMLPWGVQWGARSPWPLYSER